MQDMNLDIIGDDLAKAFEDGYQRGLKENGINEKKLRNLQLAILKDAKKRKEEIVAVDMQTFEDIKGKEVRLKFTDETLEEMRKEIENHRGY